MTQQIVIVAAILLGALAGHLLKLPSGILMGGMIAGLAAKGLVSGNVPGGSVFSVVSQLLVAYVVVSNSEVSVIKKHPEVIPVALGFIVALSLFCLGSAWLLNKAFGIDMKTAVFATAPGGLSGMAVSATDAGAEAPVALMFQLFRLTLTLVSTPLLASLF